MQLPEEYLPHFEAELVLLPSDRGGRKTPIRTRYAPNWWLPKADGRELASGMIEILGRDELRPGATGPVRILPLAPEIWAEIEAGAELEMTEGPDRTMGHATVTRVVPAATPLR